MGAQTPFFYIFREQEMIYDLWEAATGQRLINNNYFRIGGVAADLPWGLAGEMPGFLRLVRPEDRRIRKADHQQSDLPSPH